MKLPKDFHTLVKDQILTPQLYRWNLLLVHILLTKNIFPLLKTVFYKPKACFLKLKIDNRLASIF